MTANNDNSISSSIDIFQNKRIQLMRLSLKLTLMIFSTLNAFSFKKLTKKKYINRNDHSDRNRCNSDKPLSE